MPISSQSRIPESYPTSGPQFSLMALENDRDRLHKKRWSVTVVSMETSRTLCCCETRLLMQVWAGAAASSWRYPSQGCAKNMEREDEGLPWLHPQGRCWGGPARCALECWADGLLSHVQLGRYVRLPDISGGITCGSADWCMIARFGGSVHTDRLTYRQTDINTDMHTHTDTEECWAHGLVSHVRYWALYVSARYIMWAVVSVGWCLGLRCQLYQDPHNSLGQVPGELT